MENDKPPIKKVADRLRISRLGKLFYDKKFFHYTWIGIGISVLNIFLLWFTIDVLEVPTIIASAAVLGGTFLVRYVLFSFFKVLG